MSGKRGYMVARGRVLGCGGVMVARRQGEALCGGLLGV